MSRRRRESHNHLLGRFTRPHWIGERAEGRHLRRRRRIGCRVALQRTQLPRRLHVGVGKADAPTGHGEALRGTIDQDVSPQRVTRQLQNARRTRPIVPEVDFPVDLIDDEGDASRLGPTP